ncbi:hypothetical protein SEUCBS139899_010802 [Sporothrix eucalyptigena]
MSISKNSVAAAAEELEAVQPVSKHDNDVALLDANNNIRKIPIPTSNPNDPLNWSMTKKVLVMVTCCWFSIFGILSVSGIGSVLGTIEEYYSLEYSTATVQGLSTYPGLTMAVGCLALLPVSMAIGRRPVFLLSIAGALACAVGAGASKSFPSHFVARIFLGIFTGVTESLLPLIISDITFLSQRETCFGIYWGVQSGFNAAITISLSYIVAASTWRWFYWLFTIALGLGTVLAIFCLPETMFYRSPTSMDGQVTFTDEFGVTHFLTDEEALERFGHIEEHQDADIPKLSYISTLKPFSGVAPNGWKIFVRAYVQIAASLLSPGVLYGLLTSSISLGIGIAMTIIYSSVLTEKFNWSAASVGLFNVGVVPACMLATAYTGLVASKTNVWLATRNNGVHRPEHHLVSLVVPFLAGVVGIVVIAVVCDKPDTHSAWGLVIGWAIYEFSFVSILIITTSFAAEAIPHNPGPAMIVVVGGKSAVSFAATYGLVEMIQIYTYLKTFMILLGVFVGIFLLGIESG